ncbi:MAG TPA: MarR family transcriptional regulator [Pseudonocardiaceae bacterium]|nr:MarR family transcriptional regulator [Pseudonocardiaceae bacterium]
MSEQPEAAATGPAVAPGQATDSVDQLLDEWARQHLDLDFSPVGVATRLSRVDAHLSAGVRRVFEDYDLSSPDFRVIVALRRSGAPYRLPQSRLMAQLALTSGTISVRLDRLAKRGVVVREPDPADRRGQLVRLTDEGVRLFDEIAPVHLSNEDRLLSALTDDERSTLTELLRRLLISFESGTVEAGLPLGMRLEPARIARAKRAAVGLSDTPGLLVSATIAGTPAANAGLVRGDLIVAANGREVRADGALADEIRRSGRGGRLRLAVLRGDEPHRITVRVP